MQAKYQRQHLKKPEPEWVSDLPAIKPGMKGDMIAALVYKHISYFEPKYTTEILRDMNDDWGHFDERNLYRYLTRLKKEGKIKSVWYEDKEQTCYLRTGSWRDRK